MSQAKRLEATVRGRVQGVGFRWFVQRRAERLGLVGWVANDALGNVRIVAEGSPDAVDELARDLELGPPGAYVDHVQVYSPPATGEFIRFQIRVGGHAGD